MALIRLILGNVTKYLFFSIVSLAIAFNCLNQAAFAAPHLEVPVQMGEGFPIFNEDVGGGFGCVDIALLFDL